MTTASERLSRAVSHALRHRPDRYGLELDAQGWVDLDDLAAGLRRLDAEWRHLDRAVIAAMITAMVDSTGGQRHEIDGDRIRARYGHSVPGRIDLAPARPPATLFHGTTPAAWARIEVEGLVPHGRQYVHLSVDLATATRVARRRTDRPVRLQVDTRRAADAGVEFRAGTGSVWLADRVPADCLVALTPT